MNSKIEVTVGEFSFRGEGEPDWLAKQLDKVLDRAESLVKLAPTQSSDSPSNTAQKPADFSGNPEIATKTLVSFLKDKNATTNQVAKFLATSAWLEAKGQTRLSTSDVTKALKQASQTRLSNASDALAKNVGKGFPDYA